VGLRVSSTPRRGTRCWLAAHRTLADRRGGHEIGATRSPSSPSRKRLIAERAFAMRFQPPHQGQLAMPAIGRGVVCSEPASSARFNPGAAGYWCASSLPGSKGAAPLFFGRDHHPRLTTGAPQHPSHLSRRLGFHRSTRIGSRHRSRKSSPDRPTGSEWRAGQQELAPRPRYARAVTEMHRGTSHDCAPASRACDSPTTQFPSWRIRWRAEHPGRLSNRPGTTLGRGGFQSLGPTGRSALRRVVAPAGDADQSRASSRLSSRRT